MCVVILIKTKKKCKKILISLRVLCFSIVFFLISFMAISYWGHQCYEYKMILHDVNSELLEQQDSVCLLKRQWNMQHLRLTESLAKINSQLMVMETQLEHLFLTLFDHDIANIETADMLLETKPIVVEEDILTLLAQFDETVKRLDRNQYQLSLLSDIQTVKQVENSAFLSGKPIESGWQSSTYGYRKDPFSKKMAFHYGLDFAAKEGSPVLAIGSGIVTYVGRLYGYGNMIEIDHGNGYCTRYAHNKAHLVHVGDYVEKGDKIALIGNTGRSTGPHVHLEVLSDMKRVNPAFFVYRE